ncbi:hypothetical protein QQF64_035099 [Cirrhinus molitorella]|uniref:Uncharacterized protein n=1 Tax=Cirrhinus molitorella TaxID=172907 RepID=A0ABR3NF70_9TELE
MVRQEAPRTKRLESLAPKILPPSGLWLTTRAGTIPYRGSWRAEKADVSCLPLQASVSAHTAQESHTHTRLVILLLSQPGCIHTGLSDPSSSWVAVLGQDCRPFVHVACVIPEGLLVDHEPLLCG